MGWVEEEKKKREKQRQGDLDSSKRGGEADQGPLGVARVLARLRGESFSDDPAAE